MIILDTALRDRAEAGEPVRIAIVGAGYMARGIAASVRSLVGVELVAVANRRPQRAQHMLVELGFACSIQADVAGIEDAVASGSVAVTESVLAVCSAGSVDVVVEATGTVEHGAHVASQAIDARKHVVLVNAELDATVGPILKARADGAGVVISNTDGDEPGVAMNLIRYLRTIGLRPVLAGNVKGLLDHRRTPDTQRDFAQDVGQDAKRVTSYADGTKLAMEAAILANASGLGVARRGMNGFECAHVRDVLGLVDAEELGRRGIVDFVIGAEPGSGVFALGYTEDPVARTYLAGFKLGEGPLYLFYVPWHLPHAEAPLTAARAVIFHDAAVTPLGAPVCDVVTMAKRDLRMGEVLDGSGGFTCYGLIENADVARSQGLLPMGLSEDCELLSDIGIDQPINYDSVRLPDGRLVDQLWREQLDRFSLQIR